MELNSNLDSAAANVKPGKGAPAAPLLVEEHDDNGQLLLRCHMREGVLHGPLEQFGSNGLTLMKAHFNAGKMHGPMVLYTAEGALIQESDYLHGIANGMMKTYVNGRCVSVQTMVDGVPSGPSLSYDEAGLLTARLHFLRGQIQGPATFFHEGQRVRKSHYKAGLLDGECVDFDLQGNVVQTCAYRANVLHGAVRRFWPDGTLMEAVIYRDGIPLGPPLRYNAKGQRTDNAQAMPDLLERLQRLVRGS
jgi:antitoxin component YwqK of YwqJK toxin-antitoxin module